MERPEIHTWKYSSVTWEFREGIGEFVAVGIDSDPLEKDFQARFPAIALPLMWILSQHKDIPSYPKDPYVLFPFAYLNHFRLSRYDEGCRVSRDSGTGWWLSPKDLRRMWNVTKKRRPDIAVAGIKLLRQLSQ
jgi:hypothetical protein